MKFDISELFDEGEFYELTTENFQICLEFCDYFDVDIGYETNGSALKNKSAGFQIYNLQENIHSLVVSNPEVLHVLKRMGPKFLNAPRGWMGNTILELMTYTDCRWVGTLSEKNLKIINEFFPVREILEEHINNYDVKKNKDEAPLEQQIRRYKNIVDVIGGRAKRLICNVEQAVSQQLAEMKYKEEQEECERKYEKMKNHFDKFLENLREQKNGKK